MSRLGQKVPETDFQFFIENLRDSSWNRRISGLLMAAGHGSRSGSGTVREGQWLGDLSLLNVFVFELLHEKSFQLQLCKINETVAEKGACSAQ